jgi:hypothetical protein
MRTKDRAGVGKGTTFVGEIGKVLTTAVWWL